MLRYVRAALRALARAARPAVDHVSRWIQSKLAEVAQATLDLLHRLQQFVQQLRDVVARWSAATEA
jgi:hypothetical protein